MKKKGERTVNKEEICEDWCFVCKDGGLLFVCDYKECLKAYHARCVGKDEQYFDSGNQLRCDWHSCLICHRNSKFHCFCCPNAVCKSCIIKAEFACVRGEKGFCSHCLKLALLSEENVDVDSDGQHRRLNLKEKKQQEYNYKSGGASNPPKLKEETANEKWKRNPQRKRRKNYYKNVTQFPLTTSTKNSLRREIIPKSQKRSHCQEKVDFRDRETYEGLFMEYWDIIKKQEGLTLEDLRLAHDQLKKGENFKSGSYVFESEEEDSQLRSDYEDEDTVEHKPVKKNKKSKGQQHTKKRKVSKKREFVGWGSKSLIDFLASIGKDASKELSQLQVSNIVTEYINENRLFNPEKKRMILCDEKLKAVLGRKTLKRNVIYDSLGPHFADNLETSEDEFDLKSSEDDDEILLVACKKQKLSICRKIHEKEEEYNPPQSCFASITSENIKLVYLRRSLVQELLKQPGTFEGKVLGSFVKVKSDFIDFTQKSSHQLLPVTGMKKVTAGETKTEILLQVSNMSIDIGINMLSDDNFSEEECKDLRQKVKEGLLRRLTIVELEHKAKSLHEDITIHWINRELALLQNLIDRANEKGWRKELFEYMERKKLLQTPEEKSRLLETVPRVIADVEEVEPMSNDAIEESKPEDGKSTKFILMGSSETPGDNGGGSGFSSGTPGARGDRAVANSNYDFGNCGFSSANGNGNARATQQNNIGSSIQVAGGNEQTGCASIPEAKQSLATRTCILEEQPCLIRSEEREKHSKVSVIADQPSIAEKRNQSKDLEQRSMRIQEAPAVQLIDLSSDDDDNDTDITIRKEKFVNQDNDDTDITIRKEKLEDQVTSLWHCLGPNEERRGPLALSLLKRWSETSSYALKFKVWKTGEREENAISLSDAVKLFSAEN